MNPHASPHTHLKRTCIPISPPRPDVHYTISPPPLSRRAVALHYAPFPHSPLRIPAYRKNSSVISMLVSSECT